MDYEVSLLVLKTSGKIKADVRDLYYGFDGILGTQTPKADKDTGITTEDSEYSPDVVIANSKMSLDSAHSSIQIETSGFGKITARMIASIFKESIFSSVIEETEQVIQTILTAVVNQDLRDKATRYNIDGLGFDFAQIVPPKITDDDIVSLFMNGTFYSRHGQKNGLISETVHP